MYKKTLILLLTFVLFTVYVKADSPEQIDNFIQNTQINKDGTVDIQEQIYYNFGNNQRHGIYRNIPYIKTNQDGDKYKISISDIKIADYKGNVFNYTTKEENNNIVIKIGDANKYVTGVIVYNISYKVKGAITYFSDHDEFYWNLTGNEWEIPIKSFKAKITLPEEINQKDIKVACFTGTNKSTNSECMTYSQNNIVDINSNVVLNRNEGVTGVVGFPKGIVNVLEPEKVKNDLQLIDNPVTKVILIVSSILVGFGLLWWNIIFPFQIFLKWRKDKKNTKEKERIVSAWFSSPKTLDHRSMTPAEIGAIYDKVADNREISATIIDLAQRGYINIGVKNDKADYFKLLKQFENDNILMDFEKQILNALFKNKEIGQEITLSKLSNSTESISHYEKFKKMVADKLFNDGMFSENINSVGAKYTILGVVAVMTFNLILAIVSFVFGKKSAQRTDIGIEKYSESASLRNFLVSQTEQLNFQAENQMFFEKLLPYATAFGVEKIWIKRFADLTLIKPEWVEGNSNFNNALMFSSLTSSINKTVYASSMSSTRSSSGHSSGFSGGHSGGGSGGGGGGSW